MRIKKSLLGVSLACCLFASSPFLCKAGDKIGDRGGGQTGGMSIMSFAYFSFCMQTTSVNVVGNSNLNISFFENFGLVDVTVFGADGSVAYRGFVETSVQNEIVVDLSGNPAGTYNVVITNGSGFVVDNTIFDLN